jgi:hypothetical protein
MPDQSAVEPRYLDLLIRLNFDTSYYDYALSLRDRKDVPSLTSADWEKVLNEMGLAFRFNAKERFFTLEETVVGDCRVGLRLAMTTGMLEPILFVKTNDHSFSGPFQVLAYKTGVRRDPKFSPKPLYPKLAYLNKEQLREVISFSLEMFEKIKNPILNLNNCR